MKKLILAAAIALPGLAHAHGNVFAMTKMSVDAALERFQADEPTSIVQDYKGIRSWPIGDELKVRVYHGPQESIVYTCHMDHASGEAEKVMCMKD